MAKRDHLIPPSLLLQGVSGQWHTQILYHLVANVMGSDARLQTEALLTVAPSPLQLEKARELVK